MLVVDTSVLVAAADNADPDHDRSVQAIDGASPLVTTALVIAERLGVTRIATLDRRHFGVVRPNHTPAFELIP